MYEGVESIRVGTQVWGLVGQVREEEDRVNSPGRVYRGYHSRVELKYGAQLSQILPAGGEREWERDQRHCRLSLASELVEEE
jgi:hypothetical protein